MERRVTLAFGRVEKSKFVGNQMVYFFLCRLESEENFGKVDLEPKF